MMWWYYLYDFCNEWCTFLMLFRYYYFLNKDLQIKRSAFNTLRECVHVSLWRCSRPCNTNVNLRSSYPGLMSLLAEMARVYGSLFDSEGSTVITSIFWPFTEPLIVFISCWVVAENKNKISSAITFAIAVALLSTLWAINLTITFLWYHFNHKIYELLITDTIFREMTKPLS